jgi:hypothetical protein
MPKRQTTYKVSSEEVQGEGSWAELSYITYGEFQGILTDAIKPSELLEKHVIAWNWVDDRGASLPSPEECMDDLFAHERAFLLNCLYNPEETATKN